MHRQSQNFQEKPTIGRNPGSHGKVSEFTDDGLLVLEKDDRGRPIKARTVVYRQAPHDGRSWVNTQPLRFAGGAEVVTFEYDGERRKEKGREKVLDG